MSDVERTSIECQGCKRDREKRDERPRLLYRLPDEITADKLFRRHDVPLLMCLHCDGDNIEDAVRLHRTRMSS